MMTPKFCRLTTKDGIELHCYVENSHPTQGLIDVCVNGRRSAYHVSYPTADTYAVLQSDCKDMTLQQLLDMDIIHE
ncbi:MAG: hypothetical protein MJ237_06135 [bacterium]|nr:hypothetical protein [bacterium]